MNMAHMNDAHVSAAREALAQAKKARAELEALYSGPHDAKRAAALHDRIRYNLQVAKVEAALALVPVREGVTL